LVQVLVTAELKLRRDFTDIRDHYGSRSLRGTEVAAVFYTLCETARLIGVDPHAYLLHAVYAAIDQPGTVTFPEDLIPNSTTN
jgi:transposase